MRSRLVRFLVVAIVTTALGFGAVFLMSERALRDVTRPPPFAHPIVSDSATIARGRHIARTRGCFGCHGQQLEGEVHHWDWVGRAVAPNLAAYAREHDPATIEAAIRHGIGADGRALWSMPSYNFRHLRDAETAALIAFLRAAPLVASQLPSPGVSFRVRWGIVAHGETHMAQWVAAVPDLLTSGSPDDAVSRGEHLAMTTCNECHGLDLRGAIEPDFDTPDLAIVSAYPEADFRRLMAEGVAIGNRTDLGLMTIVAKDRFASFTEQELSDLYAFLRTLRGRAIPTNVFWRPVK
jgi:mono/diheme cytochrome c family protein